MSVQGSAHLTWLHRTALHLTFLFLLCIALNLVFTPPSLSSLLAALASPSLTSHSILPAIILLGSLLLPHGPLTLPACAAVGHVCSGQ